MTFTEFFTTYLAIGAPFGAYYFFKHRNRLSSIKLILKSIAAVLLWIIFAARLLAQRDVSTKASLLKARWERTAAGKIEKASQNVLNSFAEISNKTGTVTYFEFKETLERFIGLTLASQQSSANSPAASHESEIFRIVGHQPRALRLAERISHRKNYVRLQLHQSFAREDFLRVCLVLNEMTSTKSSEELKNWQSYQTEVTRLLDLLKDEKASQNFSNLQTTLVISSHVISAGEKQERDSEGVLSKAASKTFPLTVSSHGLTSGTLE